MFFKKKKLKSVSSYHDELDCEIRKLVRHNINNAIVYEYEVSSIRESLEVSFYWDETDQGYEFWESVAESYDLFEQYRKNPLKIQMKSTIPHKYMLEGREYPLLVMFPHIALM